MVLADIITFADLKLLHNFVSIQKSFFANNCGNYVRKIVESVQCDLTLIFYRALGLFLQIGAKHQ